MSTKILIVDDHQIMRSMITNMLKDGGYEFLEASNGHQALEILAANDDVKLILCDVNMPEMNGVTFLDERKKVTGHEETPILMITSERSQELIQKCKEKGVRAWITKPFKKEELTEAVAVSLY